MMDSHHPTSLDFCLYDLSGVLVEANAIQNSREGMSLRPSWQESQGHTVPEFLVAGHSTSDDYNADASIG
jgi:hypothetical protein